MHRDGLVEIGLLRAQPDRDRQKLRHFARILAEDMHAEDDIGLTVDDDLHADFLAAAGQRRLQRAKARLVDIDDVIDGAGLGLAEADRADFRRREHGGRHIDVDDAVGLPPKTVSAKAWPSRIATGVSASRSVTSPTA